MLWDEFALDVELADDDSEASDSVTDDSPVLIANGYQVGTAEVVVARESLVMHPVDIEDVVGLRGRDETHVGDDGQIAMVCPNVAVSMEMELTCSDRRFLGRRSCSV